MTLKQIIHGAGLVAAAALGALSQLDGVLPSAKLRAASGILAVLVALFTNLDKIVNAAPTLLLLLAVLPLATGCPKPTPGPVGPHPSVIQCGIEAVSKCAPQALPAVNECLSGAADPNACLLGLIQPGGCLTFAVIACLVGHEGAAADRAAAANPDDARDALIGNRARDFLGSQGVTLE